MSEELTKHESEKSKEVIKTNGVKLEVQDQITSLIPLAGTIELTKEKMDILYAPVKEEDIEIRPDGLIYLPWMEYATRLRLAFGPPVMIPYGPPKKLGNFIHWGFWLIIKGAPYGFAVGEQQYFENDRMTYGDALEGAKSNALMRICKGLGISLELWKPSFVKEWKSKFAEPYEEKGKTKWRKKGSSTGVEEGNGKQGESLKNKSVITPIMDVRKVKDSEWFRIVGLLDANEQSFSTKDIHLAEEARKEKGTGLQLAIEYDEQFVIISMTIHQAK